MCRFISKVYLLFDLPQIASRFADTVVILNRPGEMRFVPGEMCFVPGDLCSVLVDLCFVPGDLRHVLSVLCYVPGDRRYVPGEQRKC